MNKRVLNRVLIVSVIFIWSLIGYKFLFGFGSRETNPVAMEPALTVPEKNAGEHEVLSLPFISRDPFLGTYHSNNKPEKAVAKPPKPVKDKKHTPWPQIEYFGYIRNENSKIPLVLLKVNNQMFRVKKGEIKEDLTLHKVYTDSIVILKNKEKRTILKKTSI